MKPLRESVRAVGVTPVSAVALTKLRKWDRFGAGSVTAFSGTCGSATQQADTVKTGLRMTVVWTVLKSGSLRGAFPTCEHPSYWRLDGKFLRIEGVSMAAVNGGLIALVYVWRRAWARRSRRSAFAFLWTAAG